MLDLGMDGRTLGHGIRLRFMVLSNIMRMHEVFLLPITSVALSTTNLSHISTPPSYYRQWTAP